MSKKTLEIHSQNILPIIKRWLYSERDIFVRELVANATDAIKKRELLDSNNEAARIDIRIDKDAKTLTFSDTGIGMDAQEVTKYIAQVAFSSAEEFVAKFESKGDEDQIIGHFGLGFYSAFMVADKVEIQTLSYKEGAEPVFWSCDGSEEYEIEKGSKQKVGTDIILHLSKEAQEYLEESSLKPICSRHLSFLPYPIRLGEQVINEKPPLWLKNSSEISDDEYLDFFAQLYPLEPAPLFWIHLDVDYPFNLKGILYFPQMRPDYDPRNSKISLYCNRVFVTEGCQEILPEYLLALKGAIDSKDIPLNVSRSALQVDKTVRQLASHISKKVADKLKALFNSDKDKFLEVWPTIEILIKIGALQDSKFYERIKDLMVWQTTQGEWLSVQDYLDRYKDKTESRIYYTHENTQESQFVKLFEDKGIAIFKAKPVIDPPVFAFLEQQIQGLSISRIDGGSLDEVVDKEREKTLLDSEGKTAASHTAEFFKNTLGLDNLTVEAKSLSNDALPALVVMDEQKRRLRDYFNRQKIGDMSMPGIDDKKLIINTNSPLIHAVEKLGNKDKELSKELCEQIYELSLMAQHELPAEKQGKLIERSLSLYEKLTQALL